MLMIAASLFSGLIIGVVLTAFVAMFVFGLLHAEAVRIVDTHLAGIAPPAGGPVLTMRSVP